MGNCAREREGESSGGLLSVRLAAPRTIKADKMLGAGKHLISGSLSAVPLRRRVPRLTDMELSLLCERATLLSRCYLHDETDEVNKRADELDSVDSGETGDAGRCWSLLLLLLLAFPVAGASAARCFCCCCSAPLVALCSRCWLGSCTIGAGSACAG